ncbi:MAG: PAS domain S-box protein [Pseudomonadaceae bacterium]|nr:PAS domain S-box protein [Pseudomonadaceae bacterium]
MKAVSLSRALLRRFLLAFVLLTVAILLGRALLDYQESRPRALAMLNQLAETAAPGATSAIWDYQGALLQAIASGIGNHPAVQSVLISDARGKVWAHWQAPSAVANEPSLTVSHELLRRAANGQSTSIGHLLINSQAPSFSAVFTQSLARSGLSIALLLLLLLGLLWLLIQRLVVRPLSNLSHQLESLPAEDYLQPLQLQPAVVSEIASLQNTFAQLMQQVARSHAQISQHNAQLGLRVAERTAQLSEQAQHTGAILAQIVDAVLSIDEQGLIHSCNPAAERIFSYAGSALLGQNISVLIPSLAVATAASERPAGRSSIAALLGTTSELIGRRADASTFALEVVASPITRQGQPMFVAMLRDISERKRVERMKDEFVSTVSHELRTPLTSISGALGLLAGGVLGPLSAPAQEMVEVALSNSKMLAMLINDLLDMDKLVAGKMRFDLQAYDLAPLIQEAIQANGQYALPRAVQLDCVLPEQPLWATVDKQRLQQALNNFLSNALKFSPPQGRVEVRLAVLGEHLRISVRDYGQGIPDAFRACIFQKFAQADGTSTREQGGTGLGLAITRELVERMGGRVGFDSVAGNGATFWLELPRLPTPLA